MELSIVIPVKDEEKNLDEVYRRLSSVLPALNKSYEIIFIDDGSTDRSYEVLRELYGKDEHISVIKFRANFGQTAALSAGFRQAKGDVVVTLDADLQNDPGDIPALLEKMSEGCDVVSGWRRHRKDPLITKKIPSFFANKLISFITGVHLHDYGCTLKAYSRDIIKNIHLYGEMHRFIPALARWVGASIAEVEVSHFPRKQGRSKYGLSRTVRVILDLITVKFLLSFSTRPMQIFGLMGGGCGLIGFIIAVCLVIQRQVFKLPLANRPILLLAVLLIFTGIQLLSIGLLGEMQARTYHESQNKPVYVIKEVLKRDG